MEMGERIWDKFLTERDKAVFAAWDKFSGYGVAPMASGRCFW